MKRKSITLDIVRVMAALSIVLFHYTSRYEELTNINSPVLKNWPIHIDWGFGAISTFFILSGFLSSHLFAIGGGNVKKYIIKRAFRLYPTFWLCIMISCAVLFNGSYSEVSLYTILFNMTMIPNCFGIPYIDGAYWTMQMEFFFTIIMAIVILARKELYKIIILCLWAGIMLMFNVFDFTINNIVLKLFRLIVMPAYASNFIAGISLYQILFENRNNIIYYLLLIASIASSYIVYSFSPMSIFFATTIVILIFTKFLDKLFDKFRSVTKLFTYLAIISYPFYLLHQYIGYEIMDYLMNFEINDELIILVPITNIVLLASAVHLYFERPLKRLENRIVK